MPSAAGRLVEMRQQLRVTEDFISSDPITVAFERSVVERDTLHRGGLITQPVHTLPEQTVRISHSPPRRRRLENNPPNETFAELSFAKDMLIGMPDLDVRIGDEFVHNGIRFKVDYVFQDRAYETVVNIDTMSQAGT